MGSSTLYVQVAVLLAYIIGVLCKDNSSLLTDAKLITNSPLNNGSIAYLDCYFKSEDTKVQSIQWYKAGYKFPVYSFESQSGLLKAKKPLIRRAVQKPIAKGHYRLIINPVFVSDEGTYNCHVFESFFKHLQAYASLEVTVPAKKPKMVAPNTTLPAFTNLTLTCTANVGKPAGEVRWWRRGKKEQTFVEIFGSETRPRRHHQDKTTTVVSEYFTMVTPHDNDAVYKCTTENRAMGPGETPKESRKVLKVFWTGQIPDNVNIPTNSETKDKKEEGFHVAGIFVLSMAGVGLLALVVICVRRHKKLQPCRCGCGTKEEKDPTISTLQGAQVRVHFRDTEFGEDSRVHDGRYAQERL
ncbi:uncharacterized protein LOC135502318 [Lineus longissimus]|uniref:uncharacterized protein LOC135502318 n=1 Tax=Lineus longissimus TaxID=88925 RepID=UPI002B4CDBAF